MRKSIAGIAQERISQDVYKNRFIVGLTLVTATKREEQDSEFKRDRNVLSVEYIKNENTAKIADTDRFSIRDELYEILNIDKISNDKFYLANLKKI